MSTEIIIIAIAAAIIIAGVLFAQSRKSKNQPAAPGAAPPVTAAPVAALTAADYAASFFSGVLNGVNMQPYKLPAGVRGYGPGGTYDSHSFDPRFFDATRERLIAPDGHYVDVRTLTRHYPDGSTAKVDAPAMRQWLYGLSIDPDSIDKTDVLALAMVNAPRSKGNVGGTPGGW